MLKTSLLFSMLWLSSAPAHAASFDCAKASTPVEQAICRDGYLSSLDEILASTYQEAWGLAQDQKSLMQSQRDWLARRDQCPDINCITESIQQRIQELKSQTAAFKEEASKQAYAAEVEAWAAEDAAKRAALAEEQAVAKFNEQEVRSEELDEAAAQELVDDAAHAEDYAEHAYIRDRMEQQKPQSKSLNWGYWWVGLLVFLVFVAFERASRRLGSGSGSGSGSSSTYSSSSSSSSGGSGYEDSDHDVEIISRTDSNEIPRLQQSTFRVGMPPIAKACGSCEYWDGHRFTHPKLGRTMLVNKDERGECNFPRPGGRRANLRPTDGTQCRDFTPR